MDTRSNNKPATGDVPAYATYLKTKREAARLNRAQLAKMIKTNHTRLNRYELGEIVPRFEVWERLMAACKVPERTWRMAIKGFPEIKAKADARKRDEQIRDLKQSGRDVAEIASVMGLTYNKVYKTVVGAK